MKRISIFFLTTALALTPAFAEIPKGMAELTLEADDVSGFGMTGFQWILDSSHSTFGQVFFPGSMMFFGDYSRFDHFLPEDAEAKYPTDTKVVKGSVTVCVPAGTYDWMVTQPDMEGLWYALGEMGRVDDFTLLEGESYRMTFEERNGSDGWGFYAKLNVATDLAVTAVSIPTAAIDLTDAETIGARVRNNGTADMTGFTLSYSINGATPVSEIFSETIHPGESADYTFKTPADLSHAGSYTIEVTVKADRDMIGSNDSMTGKTRHLSPVRPPYSVDFSQSSEEEFMEEWFIINNSQDAGWGYSSWKMNKNGEMGTAYCQSGYMEDGDDWMISQPVSLKKGTAHTIFSVCSANEERTEYLEIYVGPTLDPQEMTKAASYTLTSSEWSDKAVNFDVPEDGVYYVAFRGVSPSTAYSFNIGDVTIDEGEFIGTPMIKLERVLAPYSNCDLPKEARLGMRVTNKGTGAMDSYSLTAYVNAEESVTKFDTPVMPDETVDLYMDRTFDLSALGAYDIQLVLSDNGETDLTQELMVECLEPLTEFPVVSNFTHDFNTEIWQSMTQGAWKYEAMFQDFSAVIPGRENGLLSRGTAFSNPARMKISYTAPGWDHGTMAIYMGLASENPSTYQRVFFDDEISSEAKEAEFTAPITEPGNYCFIIADEAPADSRNRLRLNQVEISEVRPHDIALLSADGSLAPYTPIKAVKGTHVFNVKVANRGSEPMTGIKATASLDGNKVAESRQALTLVPDQTGSVEVAVPLPEKKEGDTFRLAFSIVADDQDDFQTDNSLELPPFTVTATTFAHEAITDLSNGTGQNGSTLFIGYVYSLPEAADVTSMTVGLAPADSEEMPNVKGDVSFSIFRLKEDGTVDRRLWSETRERGMGGMTEIDFQDMHLEAGDYYFEVAQLSTYNMGLAMDPETVTTCKQRIGDELSDETNYALCIRAEFSDGARVYAKDGSATAFTAPTYSEGLYSDATTVKAVARNWGYEPAEFTVELTLDGAKAGEAAVSLLGYEEKEVSFEGIDLSKAGLHTLSATALLVGDENMANNTTELVIDAHPEADPYLMDFENCFDFDAAGDPWNPRWTTIDRNGVETDIFWRYSHPNQGKPVGFMAFNLKSTVPSMEAIPLEGFYPHGGERFGVAFHINPWAEGAEGIEASDVWIISPKLQLGDNSEFELYVKTRMLEGDFSQLEPYRVLVSETGTEPEDFKVLGDDERLAAEEEWEKVTVDLSEYDNKAVHVAVQYIGRPRANTCLMIDDLHVMTELPDSGVADVIEECEVLVNGDTITAPADSRVYTTDGIECSPCGLAPGIYLVKTPTRTVKVAVR